MMLRHLLCLVKCVLVGHARDVSYTSEAYAQPGYARCERCHRYYSARDPLTMQHAQILQKAGWSDAEIARLLPFVDVPARETLRFLQELRGVCTESEAVHVQAFEQGFKVGAGAALPRR